REVMLLTVGDPDQAPPERLIATTVDALRRHQTGYSPITGLPELRAAIARRMAQRSGRPCATENVAIVAGAQAGLYAALSCLAGPGDEVVACEPIYATYPGVAGATGVALTTVPLSPERGFHPDLAALEAAISPRSRVLWINSPHNPTGAVLSADEMATIAALCRKHDLWLLSDEVYEDLSYARPHVGAWSLPNMAERTVVVSSLSKSHAAPGFRLGWVVGPPALTGHLFNLLLAMAYGGPRFTQEGALAVLADEPNEVAALRADYRRRATMLSSILADAPKCRVVPPEGGMFVMLDVRATGLGSEGFAQRLLERHGVAVLPCDGFGASGQGLLRISLTLADDRLAEAGRRMVALARSI
ncbi:MAG: pyridoxal phosphate-dependent aminotransferase, partial [Alphaproteobacteria bacterium]|nr:pyridoxal phosphate-dependent aminotransferase [Alphaproteobacteria bacterium]